MPASGTPPHQPHDKGYKYLFHSKRAFLEFLRAFIPRDWVHQIDEDHLYRPETTYILPDFRDKEADIVYKLRRTAEDDQPEIIFYILMELQSTADFHMPYRLLLYQVEIWRDLLKNIETKEAARKDFRLPPIVPIVLYNGKAPWTAARTFRQMLKGESLFGDELLNFRYMLIDVHRMEQQTVEELVNAIKEKGVSDMQTNIERILDEALQHKLKEGLEKGREEGKRAVARKLLLKGMDIPFIVETTELSEEEIERIKRELPKQ